MKKSNKKMNLGAAGKKLLAALAVCAVVLISCVCGVLNGGGMSSLNASAYSSASYAVNSYDVDVTIRENRKIDVKERITVKFLKSGLTMFYRALPVEGDMYENVQASCQAENTEFSYYVADNEDVEGFLDICCLGGVQQGREWTYDISYTLTIGKNDVKDGMILDVIGAGWPVQLNNVRVTVHFPAAVQDYQIYSGSYGSTGQGNVTHSWSKDKTQLTIQADKLALAYNSTYMENMAQAVTLQFVLPEGSLQNFSATQMFTDDMWIYVLVSALAIGIAFAARLLLKDGEGVTPIVNLKPPKEMGPMQMGMHIDGVVDGEDVTSMIYYFASKGYLMINLQDERNPVLIRTLVSLPDSEPAYAHTIFKGLFKRGDSVEVSDLENEFYRYSDQAIVQVKGKQKTHYTGKSLLGFALGGIVAVALTFLAPLLTGLFRIGGGYDYTSGAVMAIPAAVLMVGEYVLHTHQFKWKAKTQLLIKIVFLALAIAGGIAYGKLFATHVMTSYEKYVVGICALLCPLISSGALSYTKEYSELLGDILGFKDFIVVTEEDKIKFMLQENPQLYYDVLPYAQVLGVTNEWENKFANIVIEPPSWYAGNRATVFDYMMLNRCMRSMSYTMLTRPKERGGVGRSGGGGSFGGFSGGGHGGGGGGVR